MGADDELMHRAGLLRAGELTPAPPRPAATVALLRDSPAGPEVYLLRRVPKMAFAPGMYVFPGGSVDPADADGTHAWAGQWAGLLGTDEVSAVALVRAAVRETFEEAGVLLASSTGSIVVPEIERADLEARRITLTTLLDRHGLVLRPGLLAPLQHWITPELEPRRYDTWFFAAALPPGQEAREAGSEADDRVWATPAAALGSGMRLMPPTRAALTELARYATVAEVLAAEREIATVLPRFEVIGERLVRIDH
ncbi:NUDIX domain-containing protein [Kineosporia sp. J2-2]|uniref:NUDIX domain-containing protein n=1 Tax=Kineosporia corallincola TaxID=2835133 RepID=A0ABS5T8Z8_9ACTN|nr:NUDIX domain-containing protein [Kineosporia corallincola]MBT0767538.1 NUDIX domain-containing protein [Kineosporia corallincola]